MLELKAEKRDILGKQTKTLRQKGFLPAVVYGPKVKSRPLKVDTKSFRAIWKEAGESTVIDLLLDGSKDHEAIKVLINDVPSDPLTGQPLHVDFYAVDMSKTVKAEVTLRFKGESPAVKDLGGILVKILHEVETEALPMDLPHEFVIDVTRLKTIGDKIRIKDLSSNPKVKILAEPEDINVIIEPPRSESELATPTEVKTESEAIESIKVVDRKKEKVPSEDVEGPVSEAEK